MREGSLAASGNRVSVYDRPLLVCQVKYFCFIENPGKNNIQKMGSRLTGTQVQANRK